MNFCERIKVDGDGHFAFQCLTSEDGARFFRDIRKYTSYSRAGNVVSVRYKTLWGTTAQDMTVGYRRVTFRGTGPMGVTFDGSWTHLDDSIELEQTVDGVPNVMRAVVQNRIQRALEDLKNI
jgi:hypothetical protein